MAILILQAVQFVFQGPEARGGHRNFFHRFVPSLRLGGKKRLAAPGLPGCRNRYLLRH
jgi:hypothetical protein